MADICVYRLTVPRDRLACSSSRGGSYTCRDKYLFQQLSDIKRAQYLLDAVDMKTTPILLYRRLTLRAEFPV